MSWRTFQAAASVLMSSGKSDEIHLENLHRVLRRLQDCGLKLNPQRFFFLSFFRLDRVEYLGTTISAAGISPTAEKVQAIKDAAPLTDVSELQSFLELDLPIFYLNLCRTLQSWLRLCTDYFARRYHGDGQNWNKTVDNIKVALCSDSVLRLWWPRSAIRKLCSIL